MKRTTYPVLALLLLLTACGTPEAPAEPTPTPVLDQKVNVGEYGLYINCIGEGTPTVVLDSGIQETWSIWDKVISLMTESPPTRICYYDRLRLGKSATLQIEKEPRTSQDMVDDLRALLTNANLPEPYVLVAHGMGGFNARLYASQYPDEVVGMVLVDSAHPDGISRFLALLPPESPDEKSVIKTAREGNADFASDPMLNLECWDYSTSADQVRATGSLGAIPLVILSEDVHDVELHQRGFPTGFPLELIESILLDYLAMQEELAELSSNSTHIIIPDTTYMMPNEKPEKVVDAILQVLAEVEGR